MKKYKIFILIFSLVFILSGCKLNEEKSIIGEKNMIYEKNFGKYEILKNWIEEKNHSTNNKFFYVKKGTENDDQPNNIAISEGPNKYKLDEHEKFRDAILSQVKNQIPQNQNVKVKAEGLHTKNGNIVYVVTIKEEKLETQFFYIVGDYRFVMLQSTCFNDSEEIHKVSQHIIETFVWNNN